MEPDIFMKTLAYPDLAECGGVYLGAEAGGSSVRGLSALHPQQDLFRANRKECLFDVEGIIGYSLCESPVTDSDY